MSNYLRRALGWADSALVMVALIGPLVGIVLLVVSLFGSSTPGNHDYLQFVSKYYFWFNIMSGVVIAMCLTNGVMAAGTGGTRYCLFVLGCEALMCWRIGESIHLFSEMWILIGATVTILLLKLVEPRALVQRTALNPMVDQSGSVGESESAPAITFPAVKPRFTFADVVGMQETKERLIEAGTEVVQSRKKGGQPRNGVLLSGKPGNGKTFMAEALAGELKLPFVSVSFGDVASKYINNTTEHVVKVFRDAARQAPCVLFIDEVDSLIAERNSASTYEEGAKTTNAVLTELVNIRRTGVFVIAATNFIDRLDPAAVREGRFDFKIEIPAPDSEARRHLIKRKCKARIEPETIETAVRRWEGFSVARIAAVVEEAGRMVKGGEVTFDVLKGALRTIQGRKGSIPEDTPTLDDLTMGEDNRNRLVALARRMDKIMEIEAMGGSVPRGVLFYGPPGTGKTLTARALAKTANWAFLSISGMDLLADPKRIDAIVEEASELRPCIVFIDEADDVFRDRRYSNTTSVTNKLLAAMDGAGGKVPDILYVAATNHPDTMDPAALRGGRFTEKIEFGLPDEETVFAFLKKWKAETKAQLAANFSLQKAAQRLAGHSIANVKEILQMAINNAIARIDLDAGTAQVSMQDLDLAIQSVQGDFVEE